MTGYLGFATPLSGNARRLLSVQSPRKSVAEHALGDFPVEIRSLSLGQVTARFLRKNSSAHELLRNTSLMASPPVLENRILPPPDASTRSLTTKTLFLTQ